MQGESPGVWAALMSGTILFRGSPSFLEHPPSLSEARLSWGFRLPTPPPGSLLGRTARSPPHYLPCFADKAWFSSTLLFSACHCAGAQ